MVTKLKAAATLAIDDCCLAGTPPAKVIAAVRAEAESLLAEIGKEK